MGSKGAVDRLDEVAADQSGSKMVATSGGEPSKLWSWREESNLQPVVYKTTALPIELRQPACIFNSLRGSVEVSRSVRYGLSHGSIWLERREPLGGLLQDTIG